MKKYTRAEREKIIKHVLDNDLEFFDDMFELAESNRLLEQCEHCLKYFTPNDMHKTDLDEEKPCCNQCMRNTSDEESYEEARKDAYNNR